MARDPRVKPGDDEQKRYGQYSYLRDSDAIYRESFAAIQREVDLNVFPHPLRSLVVRLVHAAGDPSIVTNLRWSENAAVAGREALQNGARIYVDAQMVAHGITLSRLPAANQICCHLDDPCVASLACEYGTTRSAAAVELWLDHLNGAVVAIGNAPTALFHLLERAAETRVRPAVILGFPVGFVGAAESKQALIGNSFGFDYVALAGRRGGSALAAAAVNALAGPVDEGLGS